MGKFAIIFMLAIQNANGFLLNRILSTPTSLFDLEPKVTAEITDLETVEHSTNDDDPYMISGTDETLSEHQEESTTTMGNLKQSTSLVRMIKQLEIVLITLDQTSKSCRGRIHKDPAFCKDSHPPVFDPVNYRCKFSTDVQMYLQNLDLAMKEEDTLWDPLGKSLGKDLSDIYQNVNLVVAMFSQTGRSIGSCTDTTFVNANSNFCPRITNQANEQVFLEGLLSSLTVYMKDFKTALERS